MEIEEKNAENIFEEEQNELEVSPETKSVFEDCDLPLGQALNALELYQLSSRKAIKLIYILGPVGSGKTTFEAMIYETFLKKIDEELLFCGSETIVGFEKRVDPLRIKSGNSHAEEPRTIEKEERQYLHLALFDTRIKKEKNFIFTDVSGEIFEKCYKNKAELETDMDNLDLAEHIVLFLDGNALVNLEQRNGAVIKAQTMLSTLKNSLLFRRRMRVEIIISKNDVVFKHKDETKVMEFIENIEDKFRKFEKDFDLNYFRVEALHDLNLKDKEKSTHLIDLMKFWSQDSSTVNKSMQKPIENNVCLKNEFNKFGERNRYA